MPTKERTFFGQPMGLATLFTVELWERFSYYGMRALLVLYLVAPPNGEDPPGGGLGMDPGDAAAIYGSYSALVYLAPLAGGWVADRITGARRSVLIGGIIIAFGHFAMALPPDALFWVGLLLIAAGTGLLKPNISKMVGDLYDEPKYAGNTAKRDAGFSLFYMGINVGAFIAPLVAGFLAMDYGWHYGFIAAGIGMVIGLVVYVVGWKTLHTAGREPTAKAPRPVIIKTVSYAALGLGVFIAILLIQGYFTNGLDVTDVSLLLTWTILLIAVGFFIRLFRTPNMTTHEKSKVRAFLGLFIGAVVFWMIYDQAGSTLTVFAEQWTNRDIFGWQMPASWFQSINPIFIIIFAPIFAALWTYLGKRAPSTPLKFAMALIGVGISFVIMMIPGFAADNGQISAIWWLVGVYLIQTWSELLLSPTGLSASTQLAPKGMASQVLAMWFLATSVGDAIGGQVVRIFSGMGLGPFFLYQGLLAIVLGICALFFVKPIKRLMA